MRWFSPARARGLTPLALVVLAATPLAAARPQVARQESGAPELGETERILHVLNRISFGPRPGDLERVHALGVEAYIEQQLNPETLDNRRLDNMLAGYDFVGASFDELVEMDRPPVAKAERSRQSALGRAASRGAALREGEVTTTERLRQSVRSGVVSPVVTGIDGRYNDDAYLPTLFWRAVYSEAQLEEVMVDFWFNHFNITSGDAYIHADYGENVIRRHALGRFHDLLVATATHPGMLTYLDNWLSTAPKDVVEERLARWVPEDGSNRALRMRDPEFREYLSMASGLNENYGRELLELHTVGVEGGYTQNDVLEVAKAFTGWTLAGGSQRGGFEFNPRLHIEGDKTVMGHLIPSGGVDEGMRILSMLSAHPSTARYIATKLVRRFVADDPPEAVVEAAARRFIETGGDMREVLRAIFYHPDFFAPEHYQGKLKKPFEAVVSGLRAVDADIETAFLGPNLGQVSSRMGEAMRNHEAPDGYPDEASAWVSTNQLMQRLVFAMDVASESLPYMSVDLGAALELFNAVGFPEPTPEQIAYARELFQGMQRNVAAGGGMMAGDAMAAGRPGTTDRPDAQEARPVDYDSLEARAIAVALVLGSPDFQKR